MKLSKLDLTKSIKSIEKGLEKNSPQILAAVGIAGMIGSVVMAVRATHQAEEAISKEESYLDPDKEELAPKDIIRVTWKYYIPTAVTMVGSAACVIASNSIHTKRSAAIATAYTLSETALKEYQEATTEEVGDKKAEKIHDRVAKKKVDEADFSDSNIIFTGRGETLCFDIPSGRPFRSDIESIRHSINNLNWKLRTEMWLSVNDLYYELNLPTISMGDQLGWYIDDYPEIVVSYSSQLIKGEPCLTIDYDFCPDFRNY